MKENLKDTLHKKSLLEIEDMIFEQKRKINLEKNLTSLHNLNSDLKIMLEIHEQKQRESGRLIRKSTKSADKPKLKSYDDYVKSKGKK